jgi:hypothetical protein
MSLKAADPPIRNASFRGPRWSGPGLRKPSVVMPQTSVEMAARLADANGKKNR